MQGFSGETASAMYSAFKGRATRLQLLAQGSPLPVLDQRFQQQVADKLDNARTGSDGAPILERADEAGWKPVDVARTDAHLDQQKAAVLVALAGFDTFASISASDSSSTTQPAMLSCSMCQRRVGVWNFAMTATEGGAVGNASDALSSDAAVDAADERADSTSQSKKQRTPEPLNPLEEHKWFCPWIAGGAGASEAGGESTSSGWEKCAKVTAQSLEWEMAAIQRGTATNMHAEDALQAIRNVLGA
jgi:hypothetical protein